jgi:hypothetical protein
VKRWGVTTQLARDWGKCAAALALAHPGRTPPSGGGAQVRRARELCLVDLPSELLSHVASVASLKGRAALCNTCVTMHTLHR